MLTMFAATVSLSAQKGNRWRDILSGEKGDRTPQAPKEMIRDRIIDTVCKSVAVGQKVQFQTVQ